MPHLPESEIKFLEKMAKRGRSAQNMQDEIFRRMPAGQKLKLGSDFSMMCMEMKLREGTKIPTAYLDLWLKANGRFIRKGRR